MNSVVKKYDPIYACVRVSLLFGAATNGLWNVICRDELGKKRQEKSESILS